MNGLKIDNTQLLIIGAIVVIFIVVFMNNGRREGLFGLADIHPSGPGLAQDSQGKWCPKHMLQPTLTGSQWPYTPVYYCRDWTGSVDTDPAVINGCS